MDRPLSTSPKAAPFLEMTLLFNFVIHAIAMLSMALLLLPAMPGGTTADDASRVTYIAHHPWLWRAGWFPWQLTALADLLLAIALFATPWIVRIVAVITLVLTAAAIIPDQTGQCLWITRGVQLASQATRSGDLRAYLSFEGPIFRMVAGWGCLGYLLGALGWTWCFAAAGTWNRFLTWLSLITWTVFAFAMLAIFLPPSAKPIAAAVSMANAIGFLFLQLWLIAVIERVVTRSRPDEAHGRYALWRYPRQGPFSWLMNWIANSRFALR